MTQLDLPPAPSNFTLYPLAWLAVCFIVGIFAGDYFNFSWKVYLSFSLVSGFLTIYFLKKQLAIVFIFLAFFGLGGLCFQVEIASIAPNRIRVLYDTEKLKSGEPVEITGVSQIKPELAVGGFFLLLKTESLSRKGVEHSVSGNVRLFLPIRDEQIAREYDHLELGSGTKIRLFCELRREEQFQNAGGISRKEILDQQRIDATAIVKSPLLIENLGKTNTFPLFEWVAERRQNLILDFKKHFSVSTAGVLIASLLGNKYHLDKTTAESFREGGTFHMLVISGLQIGFIGGLTILFLRQFTRNKFRQFVLASLFLWTYTLAVGADAPVTRAAVMFSLWHLAYVVYRKANLLNTLALSALFMLIWKPSDVFTQSFQLTFMCVLSIVAMAIPLLERLKKIGNWHPTAETPVPPNSSNWSKSLCESLYWSEKDWEQQSKKLVWQCQLFKSRYAAKLERWRVQRVLRYVVETIAVSTIVQVWLIPFTIVYFHRVSLSSIILNVPVGILMAVESVTGISAVYVAKISETLAAPLISLTEIFNWLVLEVTKFFISQDWLSLRIPHYSGDLKVVYVLYFIPIIWLTFSILKWNPFSIKVRIPQPNIHIWLAVISFALFLTVIVFHPFSAPKPDGKLRLDFLDVGQGDAALLTMPTGETILIDGGGRANFNKLYLEGEDEEAEPFEPDTQSIGETVVSNFLWERGYDTVDYLLATHADTDHIQGLTDVARNFKITSAIVARTPLNDEDFADFYTVLKKRGYPMLRVGQGDVLNFGDAKIEVLSPVKDENPNAGWDNDHSIVLRIIYGETKILMTGDIEKDGEKELLKMPQMLQADVVKVAHHGSRTSSTQAFIEATNPRLAVIPVGKHSPFGHPHEDVMDRWKNSGAKVMSTGEKGTVTIVSDGKTITAQTFLR